MSSAIRIAAVLVSAIVAGPGVPAIAAEASLHGKPASVEAIAGTKLKKVTLTQKAAQRIDVRTAEVRVDESGRLLVPYAALIYDLAGETWVYVNPSPLTFQRQQVKIEMIKDQDVVLKDGPPKGTLVLIAGVPQVYGAEVGIGH